MIILASVNLMEFLLIHHFRENFSLMSQEEKVRSVAKNIEQLIDEVNKLKPPWVILIYIAFNRRTTETITKYFWEGS